MGYKRCIPRIQNETHEAYNHRISGDTNVYPEPLLCRIHLYPQGIKAGIVFVSTRETHSVSPGIQTVSWQAILCPQGCKSYPDKQGMILFCIVSLGYNKGGADGGGWPPGCLWAWLWSWHLYTLSYVKKEGSGAWFPFHSDVERACCDAALRQLVAVPAEWPVTTTALREWRSKMRTVLGLDTTSSLF